MIHLQYAVGKKIKSSEEESREHWLDFASDKFDQQLIKDIKQILHVLVLYLPIPIFWALYDQQVCFFYYLHQKVFSRNELMAPIKWGH